MNTKEYAASIVYMLSYGKDLKDGGEDLKTILDVVDGFVRDCMPGAHLVDTFPILDILPNILSPWRKEASDKHLFEMKVRIHNIEHCHFPNLTRYEAIPALASRRQREEINRYKCT